MTVMAHVSQPYVTVGRVTDLYICSLLAALRSLFVLLHLVGILFPHINDDARSKSHQKLGRKFKLQLCQLPKLTRKTKTVISSTPKRRRESFVNLLRGSFCLLLFRNCAQRGKLPFISVVYLVSEADSNHPLVTRTIIQAAQYHVFNPIQPTCAAGDQIQE